MKKIRLEKDTDTTHTWIEINEKDKVYYGETVYKSTGYIRRTGGAISSMRHFLYEKLYRGFERK